MQRKTMIGHLLIVASAFFFLFAAADEIVFNAMFLNDVYKFRYMPHMESARKANKPDYFASIGDFLSPYVEASFDNGVGMRKTFERMHMNATIFGNHETDHGLQVLCDHIANSSMSWLSSNMDLPCPGMEPLPKFIIAEKDGKRVGFIGLLSSNMSLYDRSSSPFGGAVIEDPVRVAAILTRHLKEVEKVDEVILLTHQALHADKQLALSGNYSVIVGGHDDDPYVGLINGCLIIKGGTNAAKYTWLQLLWPTADSKRATVSGELRESTAHAADPDVQRFVEEQQAFAAGTDEAKEFLTTLPTLELLTTNFVRRLQTGFAGWLLRVLVLATPGAEGSFMSGGNIRGEKDFTAGQNFTYYNLVEVSPFTSNYPVLVKLPGYVIENAVRESRSYVPTSDSKFLQLDTGMTWCDITKTLTHVAHAPLDRNRMYTLVVNDLLLKGMDGLNALNDYLAAHPEAVDAAQPRVELKQRLRAYWLAQQVDADVVTTTNTTAWRHANESVAVFPQDGTSSLNMSDILAVTHLTIDGDTVSAP